jgi:hypothetical protein
MSVRQSVDGTGAKARQGKHENRETVKLLIIIKLDDDGNVEFQDSEGNPLSESLVRQAKRQQGNSIRQ